MLEQWHGRVGFVVHSKDPGSKIGGEYFLTLFALELNSNLKGIDCWVFLFKCVCTLSNNVGSHLACCHKSSTTIFMWMRNHKKCDLEMYWRTVKSIMLKKVMMQQN
jgi:hypothetical protein